MLVAFSTSKKTSSLNMLKETMQESNVSFELNGLESRFECPICLACLKDPVLTSCGHRFCNSCIMLWLENKGSCCPVDGAEMDKTSDLFPDHFTRREIMSQCTICSFCQHKISISEMEEHMLNHSLSVKEEQTDQCPYKSVGCEEKVSKDNLTNHVMLEINHHLSLILSSHIKLKESIKNYDNSSKALAQEALMWDPQGKDVNQQNISLMRALYERVVILEQKNHEQSALIENLKMELQSTNIKIQQMSLQHSCGHYLWTVEEFSKKIAAMKTGDNRLFFSEAFYTSPTGYKICGRINLSPNNSDQLSLLVHIMRSPHDCALDWPFTGRIHLAVIHPTNPELSIKETMMARPDLDSFKKPQRNMNTKAFGYPQFISINDIFHKGYLANDSLLVKIHMQKV